MTQLDSAGKTALDFSEQATPEVQALLKQSQVHATQHVDVESMNVGVATQLAQLASLHAQGVLTAEEFTLAKGRILA